MSRLSGFGTRLERRDVEEASPWNYTTPARAEGMVRRYYPLLQELTYIRPLRMLSPDAFVGGAASDPYTQNSCPTGWGTVSAEGETDVICAGTTAVF